MPEPTRDSLHNRVAKNGVASLVAQAIRFVIYFATAIVLAHRLSPEDFGLFGVAFAFTGFLEIAKDGGLVVPVVQSKNLTGLQLTALFWVNAATGTALTLIAVAIAPFAARLYGDTRLLTAIPVLALTFLAGGISTQHRGLLRREARFVALGFCETAALGAGCIVAVILATKGAGYWSLVGLYITLEVIQTGLTVAVSGWRPGWPRRGADIRHLLRFGGMMMAFNLMAYLTFRFDNLVVGWYAGPAALGYYEKAYQFLLLPVNQIGAPVTSVAHSALSRAQNDPDRYRDLFDRLLLVTTGLGMPLTTFLFANAPALIATLLGPQWLPSAPIFRALAPAAFLMTISVSTGWIYLSLGRAARQLRWGPLTAVVIVTAFFTGVRWGAVGVAASLSISHALLLLPTLQYTCAESPVRWQRILRIAARPAFASLFALSISMAADVLWGGGAWEWPRNLLLFTASYYAGWIMIPGGRAFLRRHLPSLRMLLAR